MVCGCLDKHPGNDVTAGHGEDYGDGRQSDWELKDPDGETIARIRAEKGYVLKDQFDFKCSIEKTGTPSFTVSVTTLPESSAEDAARSCLEQGTKTEDKGSCILSTDSRDGSDYIFIPGTKNCVVASYRTSAAEGMDKEELVNDLLKMVRPV